EHHDRAERDRQQEDEGGANDGRNRDLAEVKAQRAGRIQELVAVMRLMEAPEQWPFVVGAMPPVDPAIERQQIEWQSVGETEKVRAMPERMRGGKEGDRQHQQRCEADIQGEEAEISAPTALPGPAIAGDWQR